MRLFIGIIVGFILSVTLANAGDLILRNGRTIYQGDVLTQKPTITENTIAPTNPQINDIWRDITDNTVYIWNGTAWMIKNKSADIQAEIDIFKANLAGVNDPNTRKCLKSLGRIILKLYKDTVQ